MLKSILDEITLHLSYDAGVNGTKFTEHPTGYIALVDTPDAMWKKAREATQSENADPEQGLLKELLETLASNAEPMGNPPRLVGHLSLQTDEGSLWSRILNFLGREPEMIRDVVGPALRERMAR